MSLYNYFEERWGYTYILCFALSTYSVFCSLYTARHWPHTQCCVRYTLHGTGLILSVVGTGLILSVVFVIQHNHILSLLWVIGVYGYLTAVGDGSVDIWLVWVIGVYGYLTAVGDGSVDIWLMWVMGVWLSDCCGLGDWLSDCFWLSDCYDYSHGYLTAFTPVVWGIRIQPTFALVSVVRGD